MITIEKLDDKETSRLSLAANGRLDQGLSVEDFTCKQGCEGNEYVPRRYVDTAY